MNKTFVAFLTAFSFFLNSCTVYTEKQSEALSRAVYAAKDSLEVARVDLADSYSSEAVRIVKPPKVRVQIKPVYNSVNVISSQSATDSNRSINSQKQRVLVVPEKYKNDTVVVINSNEYQELLKQKETLAQLEQDYQNLTSFKLEIDQELLRQESYKNKMIEDLNKLQKEVLKKDLTIARLYLILGSLIILILAGIYLRIKGVL